jgi:Ni2+-binding GTPase involved in maturation of urease and hydrogenase
VLVPVLNYFDYNLERVKEDIFNLNPKCEIFEISIKDNNRIKKVEEFIISKKNQKFNSKNIFI